MSKKARLIKSIVKNVDSVSSGFKRAFPKMTGPEKDVNRGKVSERTSFDTRLSNNGSKDKIGFKKNFFKEDDDRDDGFGGFI